MREHPIISPEKEICNRLREAVLDENKAVKEYDELEGELRRLGKRKEAEILWSIRKDEERHIIHIANIYQKVCARLKEAV
jgi:hypothetical protein